MTNYADFTTRNADLSCEFGESFAAEWFSAEELDSLPRYVKGPKKGKRKGSVEWTRCTRGGWVRATYGRGYAENRVGQIVRVVLRGPKGFDPRQGALPGQVLFEVTMRLADRVAEDARIAEAESARRVVLLAEYRAKVEAIGATILDVEYMASGSFRVVEMLRAEMLVASAMVRHIESEG
jgi:hypothetical protein